MATESTKLFGSSEGKRGRQIVTKLSVLRVEFGEGRGDPTDPFNKRSVRSSAGSFSGKPLSLVSSPVILPLVGYLLYCTKAPIL